MTVIFETMQLFPKQCWFCFTLLWVGWFGVNWSAQAQAVSNYAVRVSAAVEDSAPIITLTWPADANASDYTVYRKFRDEAQWAQIAALSANAVSFVDTNVAVGVGYEYRISKSTPGYGGEGYIYTGIMMPLQESRGRIILIVENTLATTLMAELGRLQQDLVGDGWTVLRHDVARMAVDATNQSSSVWAGRSNELANVKAFITADYSADPTNTKAVFLFGRVPVPYSGALNPDSHADHSGAWPTDVFYADVDGAWPDSTVSRTVASDLRNHNVPGDGKFDPSRFSPTPSLELQVGRVDLSNLTAFSKSELELLRQYLNKDHAFRCGTTAVARRGLIDDQLGLSTGEPLAVNGWRNFAAFFGASNTFAADWLTALNTQSYLWGYGCGAGSFTSCSGVATTAQLATSDPQVVFTMFFGSYFGDWDSQNNFLRASLATTNYTLTSVWAGRPNWQFHHMALGETIGFSTLVTENSDGAYQAGSFRAYVHMGLMGDPTLRMHIVAPPSALVVKTNGVGGVNLNWNASPDAVIGYHVYRATNAAGPFTRLNGSLLTSTNYTDPVVTTNVYMVRAVKLEVSGSGSYYNASQGIFQDLAGRFGPPVLNISRVGGGVGLSWPANTLGYHLEATASLTPTNWVAVSNAVQTSNGLNTVMMGLTNSNQFFRLRNP